jgi:hypothetical protein
MLSVIWLAGYGQWSKAPDGSGQNKITKYKTRMITRIKLYVQEKRFTQTSFTRFIIFHLCRSDLTFIFRFYGGENQFEFEARGIL